MLLVPFPIFVRCGKTRPDVGFAVEPRTVRQMRRNHFKTGFRMQRKRPNPEFWSPTTRRIYSTSGEKKNVRWTPRYDLFPPSPPASCSKNDCAFFRYRGASFGSDDLETNFSVFLVLSTIHTFSYFGCSSRRLTSTVSSGAMTFYAVVHTCHTARTWGISSHKLLIPLSQKSR